MMQEPMIARFVAIPNWVVLTVVGVAVCLLYLAWKFVVRRGR